MKLKKLQTHNEQFKDLLNELEELHNRKGHDYSGDDDRLLNFHLRNGKTFLTKCNSLFGKSKFKSDITNEDVDIEDVIPIYFLDINNG